MQETMKERDRNRSGDFIAGLAAAVLSTAEFKRAARRLAPDLVKAWSGKSRIRKIILWPAANFLRWLFKEKKGDRDRRPVRDFLAAADYGAAGVALTAAARGINESYQKDPLFLSEAVRPLAKALIEETDFGEIRELMDAAADDCAALARAVNEEMWRFPAKVVCLLSFLPALANAAVRALTETAVPFNRLSPDLTADVVLSLVREVDAKRMGGLANEIFELVRKIHTGSALIGERGKSAIGAEINRITAEIMDSIDAGLLVKALGALGEIREAMAASFIGALESDPDLASHYFRGRFRNAAVSLRRWRLSAEALERVFTEEEAAQEFARGLGEIDPQEAAETVSRFCALFNGIERARPGTAGQFISQFFGSLDAAEAGDAARRIVEDTVGALKPVAGEVLPPVISGIADCIAPDGEMSPAMREACEKLKRALHAPEVAV